MGLALYVYPPSLSIVDGGSAVICWFDGEENNLAYGGDKGLGMRGDGGRRYALV